MHTNHGRALLTGASSGIGRALAHSFAADGHALVLTARNTERLEELARECRRRYSVETHVLAADLSAPAAPQEIHEELARQNIRVDYLVNNAGFAVYGSFVEADPESEAQMIQVNMVALTRLTRLFVPEMVRRGFGRIMNLGSTASFAPLPLAIVYGATKAYVLSFSQGLAKELRGTGVTVTALCPGPTETGFAARAGLSASRLFTGRVMSAEAVARIGYRAMMRGRTAVVSGFANRAAILASRFAPASVAGAFAEYVMTTPGTRA